MHVERKRSFHLPAIVFAGFLFLLGGAQPASAAQASTGAGVPPGPEVCASCHEDKVKSYEQSMHGQKGNARGPAAGLECASCHGDGTKHVEAGGGRGVGGIINPDPKNKALTADAKSAVCLKCHETTKMLVNWDSGKHKRNDVSCVNCHDPHASTMRGNTKMLRVDDPTISVYTTTFRQLTYQTCVSCHKELRAQFNKPSHHPVIEGKVSCTDCHNPHGTLSDKMIKAESVNDLCYTCHADKRGPFLSEHPPVEENCLNCHTPHGSNHNRMLVMKPPQLCQECHRGSAASTGGHPQTLVDGRSIFAPGLNSSVTARFQESGCVNCHRQIHGSNNGLPGYGEAFVR